MFEHVLKAGIPIIGVEYDDPVHRELVVEQLIAPRKLLPYPAAKSVNLYPGAVYWTDSLDVVAVDTYERLAKAQAQLVVFNPEKAHQLVYPAGVLPTPEKVLLDLLEALSVSDVQGCLHALKGCSRKAAMELCTISASVYKEISPKSIAAMRMRSAGSTPGLYPMDTAYGYWEPNPEIHEWIELNAEYMQPGTPKILQPKGLMLHGIPGTGKSMACKVIAQAFGVPAFRLDISTVLNRYIGESESQLRRNLDHLDRFSPCVVLLDEVEKVFSQGGDNGTISRMLSQLLWWLEDGRPNPCPVIMTTNNLEVIPKELYRDGRLDQVIVVTPFNQDSARRLGLEVLKQVLHTPTMHQVGEVRKLFAENQQYVPVEVVKRVVGLVKTREWSKHKE